MAKTEWDYPLIIKTYNEQGSQATVVLLETKYGLKSPRSFLSRMKNNTKYQYDHASNKFGAILKAEELFLGLDELCNKSNSTPDSLIVAKAAKQPSLPTLMQELMQEKLLELTKYIQLNRAMNTVSIDKSALMSDGYSVVIL
jgi:hypothetical protein